MFGRQERKRGCRSWERRESLLSSIFTGSELLNWELELEWVPKTLQIQLHLEGWIRRERQGGGEKCERRASGEWNESRSACSCYKSKYWIVNPQRSFPITKRLAVAKRLYLSDIILQLVVLLNVEACPFHPLVKEQQILSVSSVGVNILLQVTERHRRSTLWEQPVYQIPSMFWVLVLGPPWMSLDWKPRGSL